VTFSREKRNDAIFTNCSYSYFVVAMLTRLCDRFYAKYVHLLFLIVMVKELLESVNRIQRYRNNI